MNPPRISPAESEGYVPPESTPSVVRQACWVAARARRGVVGLDVVRDGWSWLRVFQQDARTYGRAGAEVLAVADRAAGLWVSVADVAATLGRDARSIRRVLPRLAAVLEWTAGRIRRLRPTPRGRFLRIPSLLYEASVTPSERLVAGAVAAVAEIADVTIRAVLRALRGVCHARTTRAAALRHVVAGRGAIAGVATRSSRRFRCLLGWMATEHALPDARERKRARYDELAKHRIRTFPAPRSPEEEPRGRDPSGHPMPLGRMSRVLLQRESGAQPSAPIPPPKREPPLKPASEAMPSPAPDPFFDFDPDADPPPPRGDLDLDLSSTGPAAPIEPDTRTPEEKEAVRLRVASRGTWRDKATKTPWDVPIWEQVGMSFVQWLRVPMHEKKKHWRLHGFSAEFES